jgi:hypothetical protein
MELPQSEEKVTQMLSDNGMSDKEVKQLSILLQA